MMPQATDMTTTFIHLQYSSATAQVQEMEAWCAPPSVMTVINAKQPLFLVAACSEENNWIASHPSLDVYGVGQSPAEATDDFYEMMVELYEELLEDESALSYHLTHQLDLLRVYLD